MLCFEVCPFKVLHVLRCPSQVRAVKKCSDATISFWNAGVTFSKAIDAQNQKSHWYEATGGKGIWGSFQSCTLEHKSSANTVSSFFLNVINLRTVPGLHSLLLNKRKMLGWR